MGYEEFFGDNGRASYFGGPRRNEAGNFAARREQIK
jgi:hypothetical protein